MAKMKVLRRPRPRAVDKIIAKKRCLVNNITHLTCHRNDLWWDVICVVDRRRRCIGWSCVWRNSWSIQICPLCKCAIILLLYFIVLNSHKKRI